MQLCGIGTAAVGASAATTGTTTAISTAFATAAGTGKAAGEIWGGMKQESWEGIQEMYEKGEISEEQINTFVAIKNLSDEEYEQVKKSYIEGNISKEEFEQIKEIREMPDDWKTLENGIKGITLSAATGIWEGLQWYTGGKLNEMTFAGGKALDSAVRVGIDTGFNAMDTAFRTVIDTIATGNTLGESFEEQGGWNSVLTNLGIGLIASTGGEIFDFLKTNKNVGGKASQETGNNRIELEEKQKSSQANLNANNFNRQETVLDEYVTNLQEYSSKGISIEEYLQNKGIKLTQLDTKLDAAERFGDSKLYMLETAENVLKSGNLSTIQQEELANILTKYEDTRVGDMDIITMANELSPYLSEEQMQHTMDLANTGISDTREYTKEQLASIFNYTAAGFSINAWLNDCNLGYSRENAREVYKDVSQIQNSISNYSMVGITRQFRSTEGDILECLDSVISSTNYDDAIVTYRGVKELYDLHSKIDCSSLKVGDSFASSGYQSSSVVFEKCYGYTKADTNIILKIIVPPNSGTAAYIENVAGATEYEQMEMLIKRDAVMTVVGDLEYVNINGVMKTIIPVIVQ